MVARTANPSDWQRFSELATSEKWLVPDAERRMFSSLWAKQALALVDEERFCGMVTAVVHERSGWIGNLIVPVPLRNRGYGTQLFQEALSILQKQQVSSIWLTASESGRPLYERFGFRPVQQVERWILRGDKNQAPGDIAVQAASQSLIYEADLAVWKEQRNLFLGVLVEEGTVLGDTESVALLQQGQHMQVIGPWYSKNDCPRTYRRLLQQILVAAKCQARDLVIDVCAASALRSLLAAAGFARCGSTTLMVQGSRQDVALHEMVSLASLGSIG
ncbi:MAG: GNAT family N-acetyltransferase [Deltaproteobacteria bacterium]|jgi:predicted GNAT family N-acyltransferase|nr:GNAT family N-acetyltransferase [Deltaproteobacteria bacterium]